MSSLYNLEMAYPFLDRDLISYLMNIPGEIQTERGVPKALLRSSMPGVLPEKIRMRRWKADTTELIYEGMEQDYLQLINILRYDSLAEKYGFSRNDIISKELDQFEMKVQSSNLSGDLEKLFALELWLRVFFGDGDYTAPTKSYIIDCR